MLAKARTRASAHWKAQWSFACARKKAIGGEPFAVGPRQTTAIVATAARAAPIARRRLRLPMPIVRILLVLLALASPLSMAGGAVAGPFEDAQAAHGRSDYATALRLWRPLADQGNAEAQYALGFMYARGQGVKQNNAEAAKWWRRAADQGNTFAQYNLGALYDNGEGVRQNKGEALKWYHLAAERGNDGAQFSVGLLYFAGVAVPENRVEAAKWWRRAADQGHIGAQAYLGLSYATGLGVPQDNIHAYTWLSVAAARGDQDAVSNRDRVARQMTPEQIAEAQKLASEWKPKPER
jgi:TPR repeat protein